MDTASQPDSGGTFQQAAAEASTPDPETAKLLEKHAAWRDGQGERPTPQEFGKLGAFAKSVKKFFGVDGDSAQPAGTSTQIRQPSVVGALESAQTPADSLEPVEIDDGVCQRTTAAILEHADKAAVAYIERKTRNTADVLRLTQEATEKIVVKFRRSTALSDADQKLIVKLSPDVCRELGIDPSRFAVWTVVGVLGLHSFNIWQAVQELKELAREKAAQDKKDQAAPKTALGSAAVKIVEPPTQ